MLVGITYDLRFEYLAEGYGEEETAEFDRPDTVDSIEDALRTLGFETDRIGHARRLAERLAAGHRWDIVFNIAEGLGGFGREAQVPAMLEAHGIPVVFSDALVLSLSLHKGMTKRVLRDVGVPTPDFALVESPKDIERIRLPFPLFAKPVAEGTGKGVTPESKITSKEGLVRTCRRLLDEYRQPVLVETFLPGREFTVGILGTGDRARPVGVMEVELKAEAEKDVYSYVNKERCEELVIYRLYDGPEAREAEDVSIRAWRGLGCRDGGRVDVRADAKGRINFMEVNPLAGLHPVHSDLPILWGLGGGKYLDLIRQIMESALERCPAPAPAKASAATPEPARPKRKKGGRVAVVHGEVADDAPEDEKDGLVQAKGVSGALRSLGFEPVEMDLGLDLDKARSTIRKAAPALVFNLVESVEGKGCMIHLGPSLFEAMGIPYTGGPATAMFTTSNKLVAKAMLKGAGMPTPPWVDVTGSGPARKRGKGRYVIKSVWEHASIGMDESAFVDAESSEWLLGEISRQAEKRGPVFSEVFIDGREFNISVIGTLESPRVLPHAEILFEEYPAGKLRVVDYKSKWVENSFEYNHTPRTFDFGPKDGALLDRLSRHALGCWRIFGASGYARVDFRVDQGGTPWVLEVNMNPCISPDSGFTAAAARGGLSYVDLVGEIVELAFQRHSSTRRGGGGR